MKAKTLLWLDDMRNPFLADWLLQFAPEFDERRDFVVWVKNYDEFVEFIEGYGVPHKIAFDHDLEPDKIIGNPMDLKNCSIEYGKTGMDCARYLVNFCQDKNIPLPLWVIQSANPVGEDNMNGLLTQFKKFQNGENR